MTPKLLAFPRKASVAILLLFFGAVAHAQWYAPETNYHDPVQRVFPVELARVLAWRENLATNAGIAEVRYHVTSTDDGAAGWRIDWLDSTGRVWRSAEIFYGDGLLRDGARFYREITDKLLALKWTPLNGGNTGDIDMAFWAGLGGMKPSRMATLRDILADKNSDEELQNATGAARLSGRLLSSMVPGALSGLWTIDSTLAARGAAWLALAELGQPVRETGVADCRWAVVLWLARRETQACNLWNASNEAEDFSPASVAKAAAVLSPDSAGAPVSVANPAARVREWWAFMLSRHTAREAYVRATRHGDPAWGVPLLARGGRMEGSSASRFVECVRILYQRQMAAAHDYASWAAFDGGVAGANYSSMWVAPAQADWFATMNQFPFEALKTFPGLADALGALRSSSARGAPQPDSASADARISTLCRLLYKQGAGPLVPVSAVSPADLVNFGWELHGQIAANLYRMMRAQGFAEERQKYRRDVIKNTPELAPFLQQGTWDHELPDIDDYNRFQRIESQIVPALRGPGVVFGVPSQRKGFNNWQRIDAAAGQRWLMFVDESQTVWHMLRSPRNRRPLAPFIQRLADEGGPMLYRAALDVLLRHDRKTFSNIPGKGFLQIKDLLSKPLLPDEYLEMRLRTDEIQKLPPLERAQTYERAFWADPHDSYARTIFDLYIEAGALDAAKRFYDHAEPVLTDVVAFSNNLAPARLSLALLENDFATVEKVLAASDSYSAQDLSNQIACAAARGDLAKVEQTIKAYQSRYPSERGEARTNALLDFLPLWTAITQPAHPDREKALDHFRDCDEWPTLQWLLIKQTGMSTDDAIRFLGGDKAGKERLLMIDYLRGDKDAFMRDLDAFLKTSGLAKMARIPIQQMRRELHGLAPIKDVPDLCPPEPQSIPMAVQTAREAFLKTDIDARLAAISTEEVLWNHIQTLLKGGHSEHQDARARVMEMEKAAGLYFQRYPDGPHFWELRLITVFSSEKPPVYDGKLDERLLRIADEPAAPLQTRMEAASYAFRVCMAGEKNMTPENRKNILEKIGAWREMFAAHEKASGFFDMAEGELQLRTNPAAARQAYMRAAESGGADVATAAKNRLRQMDFMDARFEMSFTAVDGRKVDSAALLGKVVLVDFWATWCAPCTAGIPRLLELYKKYNERGFEIVGISLDTDAESLKKFITNNGIPWPNHFETGKAGNRYAGEWSVFVIPAKYLIDKSGRKHPVAADANLDEEITRMLAE